MNKIKVEGACVITGKYYAVEVERAEYAAWRNGTVAQEAFPNLPPEDREFLISGISPEGWEQMSATMDEDFEGDI